MVTPLSLLAACHSQELGIRQEPVYLVQNPDGSGTPTDDTTTDPTDPTDPTDTGTGGTTTTITTTGEPPIGVDVSHWQGDIDWNAVVDDGIGFAIMKATEGTYYTDDLFGANYDGSYDVGLVRGAYHFGIPDDSSGAEQADYFVDNGGGWSGDGQTLPGTLDIEWNPYWSDSCYGLSQNEMEDWIADFLDQYYVRTGRDAMIYTAASWWSQCVDATSFGDVPLWIANWEVTSPTLAVGWSDYTFWQTSAYGSVNGIGGDVDMDTFNGSPDELYHFALAP